MVIALCLVAALALAAACGGGEEEGPGGVELPEGFPADFPLYQKAAVEAATVAPEGGGFLAEWRSSDSADQVRAFYERELDKDPWQVENVVEIAEEEIAVIEFARVDRGGEWGTVAIRTVRENGQHVTIALSLTAPQ
ncbi:MAG: hypothetical protein AMJ38_04355 [Dehalococcoidia bacterium DG_22]|nr:MAG: hypothetical protein AMJ38_04355 [Dehalococcoidia bacterium DG_22]